MEGNFALFLTYALDHREDFQNILLVIMVSVINHVYRLYQDIYFGIV